MTRHFSRSARTILAWFTLNISLGLCGCAHNQPVQVHDHEYCGWLGAVGGPGNACSCVHTIQTSIPPAHYDLDTCLDKLVGSIFIQGAAFNEIQLTVDTLCTDTQNGPGCTYDEKQKVQQIKYLLRHLRQVTPRGP